MIDLRTISDLLIVDLKKNIGELKTVDAHEREFDESTAQSLVLLTPFVLVRYGGGTPEESERTASGGSGVKKRWFFLTVGAQSLRSKKEAQLSCYDMLMALSERYDGATVLGEGEAIVLMYEGDEFLFSQQGLMVYRVALSYYD